MGLAGLEASCAQTGDTSRTRRENGTSVLTTEGRDGDGDRTAVHQSSANRSLEEAASLGLAHVCISLALLWTCVALLAQLMGVAADLA